MTTDVATRVRQATIYHDVVDLLAQADEETLYRIAVTAIEQAKDPRTVLRVNEATRSVHRGHQVEAARSFRPGDRVAFTGRFLETVRAVVVRPLQKYVLVRADDGKQWRVTGTMLTREDS